MSKKNKKSKNTEVKRIIFNGTAYHRSLISVVDAVWQNSSGPIRQGAVNLEDVATLENSLSTWGEQAPAFSPKGKAKKIENKFDSQLKKLVKTALKRHYLNLKVDNKSDVQVTNAMRGT